MVLAIALLVGAVVLVASLMLFFAPRIYRAGVEDFNHEYGTSINPDDLPGPWRDA